MEQNIEGREPAETGEVLKKEAGAPSGRQEVEGIQSLNAPLFPTPEAQANANQGGLVVKVKESGTQQQLVEPRTLKGFRDLLPREAIVKNQMLAKLVGVFESFGFLPIQTPHLEYTECLFGEAGGEIQKQVYRFQDHGKRDVSLRFDLTVPFARFISQHKSDVGLPFKRWAVGEVFRGENTQAGRYREFTQCDFDFVGTESLTSDAEIVQVIDASLRALGVERFQVRINNRKAMNGLAAALGFPEKSNAVLQEVDKLEKVGRDAVRSALVKEHGLSESAIDELLAFVSLTEKDLTNNQIIEQTQKYRAMNPLLAEGLSELETVVQMLSKVGISHPKIKIDLSIARGLGYYTGIVYETVLLDKPKIGSVCSGGRYDNLTQTFQKDRCPGVGASVGIDRLIAGLQELGMTTFRSTTAEVLVTHPRETQLEQSMAIAAAFRARGISAELYPDPHKMKKQIDYAKRLGHPFIITFGADGTGLTLERLDTGERISCGDISDLVSRVEKNKTGGQ